MDPAWLRNNLGIASVKDLLEPSPPLVMRELACLDMVAEDGTVGINVFFDTPALRNGDNALDARIVCKGVRTVAIDGVMDLSVASIRLEEYDDLLNLNIEQKSFAAAIMCASVEVAGGYMFCRVP